MYANVTSHPSDEGINEETDYFADKETQYSATSSLDTQTDAAKALELLEKRLEV